MSGRSITLNGAQAACAEPYGSAAEAVGMAELLARGGWDVRRHDPPTRRGQWPGTLVVASVYSAEHALVGTITCLATGARGA